MSDVEEVFEEEGGESEAAGQSGVHGARARGGRLPRLRPVLEACGDREPLAGAEVRGAWRSELAELAEGGVHGAGRGPGRGRKRVEHLEKRTGKPAWVEG